MRRATWSYPTIVRFGAGRISELADAVASAGIARPLLITDRGLAVHAMVVRARDRLGGAPLFAEVDPNPTDANLAAGLQAFRAGAHDGVVALGGGSALDLGKLVAFQAGQGRPVWEFEDRADWWTRADAAAIRPVVALPTTAGTGSEVGRAAVLTDTAAGVKRIIYHPRMMPAEVIADPELTVSMPRAITVGTGMDALAHCLEAACAPSYHPMSAGIAVEGLRLVFEALPRVADDPTDIAARADMMSAAMMGAVAFQKGLGAIHAISHPVGARYGTHHGTTNAVVMPYVLAHNRAAIEPQIARAAAYCGLALYPGEEGSFEGFLTAVQRLRARLGVPDTLAELGVTEDAVPALAEAALADPTAGGNPMPLTREGLERLIRTCITGMEPDAS